MVIQNCCAAYQDGIYGSEAIDIIMKESLAVEAGIRKLLYVSSFVTCWANRATSGRWSSGD